MPTASTYLLCAGDDVGRSDSDLYAGTLPVVETRIFLDIHVALCEPVGVFDRIPFGEFVDLALDRNEPVGIVRIDHRKSDVRAPIDVFLLSPSAGDVDEYPIRFAVVIYPNAVTCGVSSVISVASGRTFLFRRGRETPQESMSRHDFDRTGEK